MAETTLTADHPIIGYWQGNVTISNVGSANGSNPMAPVSNLANPSTYQKWKSSAAITDRITIARRRYNARLCGAGRPNFPIGTSVDVSYDSANSPADPHSVVTGTVTSSGRSSCSFTPVVASTIYVTATRPIRRRA